jgi:ABC-2 type transport system permease protein
MSIDWTVVRTIVAKDLRAVRRSKALWLPMLLVPAILLVALPMVIGFIAARTASPDVAQFLDRLPGDVAEPITRLPPREQLVVLVNGYLLAPLFLIVPLMVSAVLAADAFAGEKERRTMEALLHLPVRDRDLYVGKLMTAFVPAVAVSWIGFVAFCVVSNAVAWPVMHRLFVPTGLWLLMIFWVAPAVAALGLGVMVRVSARARTAQEANQLGGAVILPLIFLALGQATGLLFVRPGVSVLAGGVMWMIAIGLNVQGASRFARDRLAATI